MSDKPSKLMIKVIDKESKGFEKPLYANFNPKEYALSKSVPWNPQNSSGVDAPPLQFTSGQGENLDLELFFDTFEKGGSVTDLTKPFHRLALIDSALHRPPRVLVSWGALKFQGVVESVNQRFTMFASDGTPVRATLTMKLREAREAVEQAKGTPPESPDRAKLHAVRRGETLQSIAAREYDDPGEWRRIADANGIDDPARLEPGLRLLVPPIIR